jgi:hypothetical protein
MSTTPPENHIAWTVAAATNTLRFEHVGCSVGDGTWTRPLDDIPLPLAEKHCTASAAAWRSACAAATAAPKRSA